jgi:hypothetical protein
MNIKYDKTECILSTLSFVCVCVCLCSSSFFFETFRYNYVNVHRQFLYLNVYGRRVILGSMLGSFWVMGGMGQIKMHDKVRKCRFLNLRSLLTEVPPSTPIIAMPFTKALLCLFAALASFASAEPGEKSALIAFGATCADGATPQSLALLQRSAAREVGMQGGSCGMTRAMTVYTGCGYTYVVESDRNNQCGSGGTSKLIFDSFSGGSSCGMTRAMTVYTGCGYTYVVQSDRDTQCGGGGTSMIIFDSWEAPTPLPTAATPLPTTEAPTQSPTAPTQSPTTEVTWVSRPLVAISGAQVGETQSGEKECREACNNNPGCKHITLCRDNGQCLMRDKEVTMSAESSNSKFLTARQCESQFPQAPTP